MQQSNLEKALAGALNRRRESQTLRSLTTPPPGSVDFSSNDFLSLATNVDLHTEYLSHIQSQPALLGSGGSRLLDGNSSLAEDLERTIVDFHRAPTGLLCNSGFDANVGLFSCLPQSGDYIVYDELIHASVHDGMRLSRARKCIPFAHNDVASLRHVLINLRRDDADLQTGKVNVFVAVETVYSMDGDVAPLSDITMTVKAMFGAKGNAHCVVDEAHSTGVYGPHGRGLVCELGLESEFLVRLHTFGKALACNGAILLCSPTVREYLINYARPMIYTTFMSYPALAAVRASYSFLISGRSESLAQNLTRLISVLHEQLLELQQSLHLPSELRHLLQVPTVCPQSPIFSVLSSEPKALAAFCQKRRLIVRGIVSPTVPAGTERIRICLHAGNTEGQIQSLVQAIGTWVEQRARELNRPEFEARPRL